MPSQTPLTPEQAVTRQLKIRKWQLMSMVVVAVLLGFMTGYALKGIESNRILYAFLAAYSDRAQDTRSSVREAAEGVREAAEATKQATQILQEHASETVGDTTRAARRSAEHARQARDAQKRAEAAQQTVEYAARHIDRVLQPPKPPADVPDWLDGP